MERGRLSGFEYHAAYSKSIVYFSSSSLTAAIPRASSIGIFLADASSSSSEEEVPSTVRVTIAGKSGGGAIIG